MEVSFDLMCIDEHDSPNLTELKNETLQNIKAIKNRRHFGLCGVIIPGAEYPDVNINGRKIQERFFGVSNYRPFHYVEMLNKSGNFAKLGTNKSKTDSLFALTNNFLRKTKFKIIASFVDKQLLALKYGVYENKKLVGINKIKPGIFPKCTPSTINLYDISLKHLLSEYYKYLLAKKKRGIIIAEARGEKEDQNLLNSFYLYQKNGTGSLTGSQLRTHIVDLLIIRKQQNHLGLQIADLVTYPLYDMFVPNHNVRTDHFVKKDSFEKNIISCKVFP